MAGAGAAASLANAIRSLRGPDLDRVVQALEDRKARLFLDSLPDRMILVRHGESEHSVSEDQARSMWGAPRGDSMLELTPRGLSDSVETGKRLRTLLGDDHIFVVASPFERATQTLMALSHDEEGLTMEQMGLWHVTPQIREKEAGNFQSLGAREMARAEQSVVGRFYYRRPNAESSADVYDRVSAFWDELINSWLPTAAAQAERFQACVIVTHGLIIRLILMKVFKWSVETFETVWNIGSGCHVTLRKNIKNGGYVLSPEESHPPQVPLATRNIWVVKKSREAKAETAERLRLLKSFRKHHEWDMLWKNDNPTLEEQEDKVSKGEDSEAVGYVLEIDRAIDELENRQIFERSDPFHVNQYLTIPQPRTEQVEALQGRLFTGHWEARSLKHETVVDPVDFDDVDFIDWWGPTMSYQGKMLRMGGDEKAREQRASQGRVLLRRLSTNLSTLPDSEYDRGFHGYSQASYSDMAVGSRSTT